jgi:hypothetical protein
MFAFGLIYRGQVNGEQEKRRKKRQTEDFAR